MRQLLLFLFIFLVAQNTSWASLQKIKPIIKKSGLWERKVDNFESPSSKTEKSCGKQEDVAEQAAIALTAEHLKCNNTIISSTSKDLHLKTECPGTVYRVKVYGTSDSIKLLRLVNEKIMVRIQYKYLGPCS